MGGDYLYCFFIESKAENVLRDDFLHWEKNTKLLSGRLHALLEVPVQIPLTGVCAVWMTQERGQIPEEKLQQLLDILFPEESSEMNFFIVYTNYLVPEKMKKQMLDQAIRTYEQMEIHTGTPVLLRMGRTKTTPVHGEIYLNSFSSMIGALLAEDSKQAQLSLIRMIAACRFGKNTQYSRHLLSMITASILGIISSDGTNEENLLLDGLQHAVIAETWTRCVTGEIGRCLVLSGSEEAVYQMSFQQKVVHYIDNDLDNPELSLKTASARFGLTPSYFSSKFKDEMHINFNAYVEQHRMQMAMIMLKEQHLSILDTCTACGYQSTATFRRVFRKYYGINPSEALKTQDGKSRSDPQDLPDAEG